MRNKTVIITGASKGIGESLSYYLANKGFDLLLIARTEHLLKNITAKIKQQFSNVDVQYCAIDITNGAMVESFLQDYCKTKPSIDVLVNNAGFVKRGTSDISEPDLSEMLEVNLKGLINITKAVVPYMKKQGFGHIINMSSRNAKIPRNFLGVYAATKAGVLAYNEALYKELVNYGIKVTALAPGFVNTQMTSEVKIEKNLLIQPEDICGMVDFLLGLPPYIALKELFFEASPQVGKYA